MSSILDQKQEIYGNIAAARSISEGLPTLPNKSSIPSVSNNTNMVSFLTDLIKSLVGYDALVSIVVNTLTYSLSDIENEIKIALKTDLKGITSCGVNPSLPPFMKSTGSGIVIELNKIDFLGLFKTTPNSPSGPSLYNNITSPLTNSTDLNTFLYGVIQDDGNTHTWGGILDITFNSLGTGNNPNNTLTLKANSSYNTKTLTDFNNNFVDSLTLFNSQGVINKLIDLIFGSVSVTTNKTKKQLETEAQINSVVDNLVNADINAPIDDSYFTFTNDQVYQQQESATTRKNGIVKLQCCNKIQASVPASMLATLNTALAGATTTLQQQVIINNNLNAMAAQTTANADSNQDVMAIKLNFFQNLIDNLIKAIVSIILSPKVIIIFLVNYNLIYGTNSSFNNGLDFILKNKVLINSIIKKVVEELVKILMIVALKEIANLVAGVVAKREAEKATNQLVQTLSLIGISGEAIRLIQGLS